ncbi:MAG: GMC oxidoreductase, partial [Actinomycetota bacterium]
IMGGMRMGADPKTSVTNEHGRMHALDNVLVADGSVFVTSGSHNPTLTIMATALRNARALVSSTPKVKGVKVTPSNELPATGAASHAVAGAALIGTAATLAASLATPRSRTPKPGSVTE